MGHRSLKLDTVYSIERSAVTSAWKILRLVYRHKPADGDSIIKMPEAIRYSARTNTCMACLEILHEEGEWKEIECAEDAFEAITKGWTQDAALIAVLAISSEYQNNDIDSKASGARNLIVQDLDHLGTSSAVVKQATDKLKQIIINDADQEGATGESVRAAYVKAAERLYAVAEA